MCLWMAMERACLTTLGSILGSVNLLSAPQDLLRVVLPEVDYPGLSITAGIKRYPSKHGR